MADIKDISDIELQTYLRKMQDESNRRLTLRESEDQIVSILESYLAAKGIQPEDAYVRPKTLMEGYPKGFLVSHNGYIWESLVTGSPFEPREGTHWTRVESEKGIRAWAYSADGYDMDSIVSHKDYLWKSLISQNDTEPGQPNSGWGWLEYLGPTDPSKPPLWVIPSVGSGYPIGSTVSYNGRTWRNEGEGPNVREPGTPNSNWVVTSTIEQEDI